MQGEYDIRFRHTAGDVGPLKFAASSTVQEIKERLLVEWPTEGPLLKERPGSAAELRLILSGRFLSDTDSLRGLHSQNSLGEPKDDYLVTMHVIVRPPAAASLPVQPVEKKAAKTCCTIS
ncbi:hypothetical protein N2152v2_000541 [Parachlorella kessleri]